LRETHILFISVRKIAVKQKILLKRCERCALLSLFSWMVGWLAGRLAWRPAGWLAGWLAGRLSGWSAGQLAGWLAGRLVSRQA